MIGRILPPLSDRRPFSYPYFTPLLLIGLAVVSFVAMHLYSNKQLRIIGVATTEDRIARSNLLIVVFIDDLEIARTISFNSPWEGQALTTNEQNRARNFDLQFANYYGYQSHLLDFVAFLPTKEVPVNIPFRQITPGNQLLELHVFDPQVTANFLRQPLRIVGGIVEAIPAHDLLFPQNARLATVADKSSELITSIPVSIRVFSITISSLLSLSSNIVAAFLQDRLTLLTDLRRFALVLLIYVGTLITSVFLYASTF